MVQWSHVGTDPLKQMTGDKTLQDSTVLAGKENLDLDALLSVIVVVFSFILDVLSHYVPRAKPFSTTPFI